MKVKTVNIILSLSMIAILCTTANTFAYDSEGEWAREQAVLKALGEARHKLAAKEKAREVAKAREVVKVREVAFERREALLPVKKPEPALKNIYMKIGQKFGQITGDTGYRIWFDNNWVVGGHGESELIWPLSNNLYGIEGVIAYRNPKNYNQDKARLTIVWLTNFTKDSGTMEDYDWIENDDGFLDYITWDPSEQPDFYEHAATVDYPDNSGLDIYGELDTELKNLRFWDINYVYNFFPFENQNIEIGPIVGYKHQKLEFYGFDLIQRGYGPHADFSNYTDTDGWRWGKYSAEYRIPYLGLSTGLVLGKKNRLKLNLILCYGYVKVEDKDSHLYPSADAVLTEEYGYTMDYNMIMSGSQDGEAYLVALNGGWEFGRNWSLNLNAEYQELEADGYYYQTEYDPRYADPWYRYGDVSSQVTSSYWILDAEISYRF